MRLRQSLRHRTGPIPGSMSSLHGYQIVARCDGSHRGLVEGAMRREFAASPLQVERIDAEPRVYGPLARIRMRVRASNAERSGRQRGVGRVLPEAADRRLVDATDVRHRHPGETGHLIVI